MTSVQSVKLVLLGESAVGKTSLVLRFVRNEFYEYQESTIGAAYLTQTVAVPPNNNYIKFELWDTAGQERYRSLAPMYYRGAPAAIVMYDITQEETFARAKQWVKELQNRGDPNVVIALVGNKVDMEDKRQVNATEASNYAATNNLIFMETSAKTNTNVQELFIAIGAKLPQHIGKSSTPGSVSVSGGSRNNRNATGNNNGSGSGCACIVM